MKYIDAEKLIKAIEEKGLDCSFALKMERLDTLALIDELQREQPKSSNGKFVFPKFLYARTVDNKTIDVSYAPQSMDALEYIKNDPTEQPEANIEKEIDACWQNWLSPSNQKEVEGVLPKTEFAMYARHFVKWGADHLAGVRKMVKPQNEPNYTKRNELFDKCVENCDPKVMQEVSDNVDKLKSISTPAEEDWFKVAEEWEKEDKQPVTDCDGLKELSWALSYEIDRCITDLLLARFDKDEQHERKTLSRMESLMVETQQQLSCIVDYLENEGKR